MAIKVQCPNPQCGLVAQVPEESLGHTGRCKRCGTRFMLSPSVNGWAPPSIDTFKAGAGDPLAVIGRYQVREKLGRGAFGTVYRAYDPQLDREVALKVLRPEALASPQAVERFQREARAAAKMHHPHIVPVHDAGQHGEKFFIASAFIRGRTLDAAIPEEGLDQHRAAQLTLQLAEALAYAHQHGVLHRDVKPANIMVDDQDTLYLMDFGLASWAEQASTRLTQAGAVMGTPAYMAPEQASGEVNQVGPAADLYSAGVVLYEVLTGRVPFEGPRRAVIYNAIHTSPQPPSQVRSGLDPRLEAICLKAMAKKPGERYASGQEMAAALKEWLLGQQLRQQPHEEPSMPDIEPVTLTMEGAEPNQGPRKQPSRSQQVPSDEKRTAGAKAKLYETGKAGLFKKRWSWLLLGAAVASYSWARAKILFVVFLILALLSFVAHGFRRRSFWG